MAERDGRIATLRCDFGIAHNERKITVIAKLLTPLFIAGAATAGIALAPTAVATTPDCAETPTASVCHSPGHNSAYTTPNMTDPYGSAGWPMGFGPTAPMAGVG